MNNDIEARHNNFSKEQLKFLAAMGLVMGFRELSMTMLNPFITIYGGSLEGSTPFLCGIALGIYGLTNAFFQIPYGSLSDRKGRKPVILVGLIQLILGLFLAYMTKNIYVFILARALQGSGAVMAIAYSWLGDNIEDSKKNRAMGIAGTIVALGAVIAFGAGPLLYNVIPVNIMFLGCSFLIFAAWFFILVFIKEDKAIQSDRAEADGEEKAEAFRGDHMSAVKIRELLKDGSIIRLSICGFIINYVMSYMFFIVPEYLEGAIGGENMWRVFLPAILCGIIAMRIATSLADKGYFKITGMTAFILLAFGSFAVFTKSLVFISIGVVFILAGFMCLTSEIPSLTNKLMEKERRGAANGILQTMTFLGFFIGPSITGILYENKLFLIMYIIPIVIALCGILLLGSIKAVDVLPIKILKNL
jgi:MFS family permease